MGGNVLAACDVTFRRLAQAFLHGTNVDYQFAGSGYQVEDSREHGHGAAYRDCEHYYIRAGNAIFQARNNIGEPYLQCGFRIDFVVLDPRYPVCEAPPAKVNRHRTSYQSESNYTNVHNTAFIFS